MRRRLPAYFVMILLPRDLTRKVSFPTRIPDPYLLDLFLCSNSDKCSVSPHHPPFGTSDHLVTSVEIDFMVKFTNVYNFNNAYFHDFRDYLRGVPWLDIFGHVNKAGKEISDWIQIGIECSIPHQKYQVKPNSLPWFTPSCADAMAHRNHYFHQFHRNKTRDNKKRFSAVRNHCKRFLEEAKSKDQSVASQHIGSRDFWKISDSIPPLFNVPEVLTSSKDKADLFAWKFSVNSTLGNTLHILPDFPSRTEQKIIHENHREWLRPIAFSSTGPVNTHVIFVFRHWSI